MLQAVYGVVPSHTAIIIIIIITEQPELIITSLHSNSNNNNCECLLLHFDFRMVCFCWLFCVTQLLPLSQGNFNSALLTDSATVAPPLITIEMRHN